MDNHISDKTALVMEGGIPITEDITFSFDGYQVVRGEFFAHIFEPSLTLSNNKIYVNTACIKKLPNIDFVQLLVNADTKKVVIRPCTEDVKDSFRWCSSTSKRTPKQITARIPFGMIFTMMGWNTKNRYKLLGKLIKANDELLFVFDLSTPEVFLRKENADGKEVMSRKPSYPDEWKNQFGVPVEEHQDNLQINLFDGFTVFSVKEQNRRKKQKMDRMDGTDETHTNNSLSDSVSASSDSLTDATTTKEDAYEQTSIFGNETITCSDDRSNLQLNSHSQDYAPVIE